MPEILKDIDKVTEVISNCLTKRIHFAAYKLPGKTGIEIVIQKDPVLQTLDDLTINLPQRGFLIAPFLNEESKAYLIRPEIIIRDSVTSGQMEEVESLPAFGMNHRHQFCPGDTQRDEYIQLIRDAIQRIHAGEFEKVVLSRIKSLKGNTGQLHCIFKILCDSYPNAFVYLLCINGQCWTGATPEPFMCSSGREFVTVSLAGTRPYRKENLDISNWNHKELQEQEYVTLHIEKVLRQYIASSFKRNGPYVARAGNLLHLRTDFVFSAQAIGTRLPSLINALHPTPAICGMSTGKAMDFIRTAEKHSREYYTGFLGPVGLGELIQLYVNLRCMKVCDSHMVLFVGGGITGDSVPEEEWEETEIKAETLLSVLHQIG